MRLSPTLNPWPPIPIRSPRCSPTPWPFCYLFLQLPFPVILTTSHYVLAIPSFPPTSFLPIYYSFPFFFLFAFSISSPSHSLDPSPCHSSSLSPSPLFVSFPFILLLPLLFYSFSYTSLFSAPVPFFPLLPSPLSIPFLSIVPFLIFLPLPSHVFYPSSSLDFTYFPLSFLFFSFSHTPPLPFPLVIHFAFPYPFYFFLPTSSYSVSPARYHFIPFP